MPAPTDPVKRALWIERISNSKTGQGKGIPLSETHAKKISEGLEGIPKSQSHKDSLSKSMIGNIPWNVGIPHTDVAKAKMSAKKKDIPLSEIHKQHLSESHKGQIPHITPESIEKNRQKHLNKKASQETKDLMSVAHTGQVAWNKGKEMPVGTGEKISKKNKGQKRTESTRKKMRGENNNNWSGGTTSFLKMVRELPEMVEWKTKVMKRDNYCDCFTGWRGSGNLEVHHIIPMSVILIKNNIKTVDEAMLCEELWDIENGITMIKENHTKHHAKHGLEILPKSYYSQKSN